MSDDVVLVEVADRIATVTLNRPERRNALSSELLRALPSAITSLDADDDVDVLILTGADPAFCAGLDLRELGSREGGIAVAAGRGHRGPFPPITKPLIGAINGPAVTGGLELALACDFLVASPHAMFADTHARVGVMPGWGLSVLLPEAVGVRRARQMSITGNFVGAEQALAWGLVNVVVPHERLLARCRELAADIVGNDRAAVRQMLRTYTLTTGTTIDEAWEVESRLSQEWARGFTAESVAARREGIISRGRTQL